MLCLSTFFDAMFGVKKLTTFIPVITCPTSAYEPSYYDYISYIKRLKIVNKWKELWQSCVITYSTWTAWTSDYIKGLDMASLFTKWHRRTPPHSEKNTSQFGEEHLSQSTRYLGGGVLQFMFWIRILRLTISIRYLPLYNLRHERCMTVLINRCHIWRMSSFMESCASFLASNMVSNTMSDIIRHWLISFIKIPGCNIWHRFICISNRNFFRMIFLTIIPIIINQHSSSTVQWPEKIRSGAWGLHKGSGCFNLLPPRHINNGHNDTKIGTRTNEG